MHRTLCSNAGVKNPDLVSEKESLDKPGLTDDIPQYDIAIVGGGMVGMALACSLATMPLTKQLSVAIIDSNPALVNNFHIKKEDPPDPRVSTVTPATISFFKDMGAWEFVQQHRHAYFDKMQRSGIILVWAIQGTRQEMLMQMFLGAWRRIRFYTNRCYHAYRIRIFRRQYTRLG